MSGDSETKLERAFKELDVSLCSAVSGETRFPPEDWGSGPTPMRYRNNLTALSQYQNLYFVAINSHLHVFQPHFPSQKLSPNPDLKIELPVSRHELQGMISPGQPHAVNQLIVGDMGKEELVVCVCDDGDVIAYTTRSFANSIREKTSWTASERPPDPDMKPFFHRNVGLSAWGVAIHKRARVIAVSSNSHKINIFAFGLERVENTDSQRVSDSNIELNDEYFSEDIGTGDHSQQMQSSDMNESMIDRTEGDIEFTLESHSTNIPNVAFCGSDTDPDGKYLASIDIHGKICIWDIWARRLVHSHSDPEHNPLRPYSRKTLGWSILCLEPQFFRLTRSIEECCGCKPSKRRGTWDLSASRHEIRNNSTVRGGSLLDSEMQNEDEQGDDPEGETDEDDDPDDQVNRAIEEGFFNLDQLGIDQYATDVFMAEGIPGSHFSRMDFTLGNSYNIQTQDGQHGGGLGSNSRDLATPEVPQIPNDFQSLPFSILHTSVHNIMLRQEPTGPVTVKIDNALDQDHPLSFDLLGWSDRLNMTAQIPELGVIVVASQIGRAALLTLTQVRLKGGKHHRSFRVDWILPFKSEEDEDLRPNIPLAGIAVGPVQGREFKPERSNDSSPVGDGSHKIIGYSRRYRLMLTYLDNTVLSYEIGRPTSEYGSDSTRDDTLIF